MSSRNSVRRVIALALFSLVLNMAAIAKPSAHGDHSDSHRGGFADCDGPEIDSTSAASALALVAGAAVWFRGRRRK